MPELAEIKRQILTLVTEAENQRRRPHELHETLLRSLGASRSTRQQALNDLLREGRLIFTYRDPWSYVELPGASVLPATVPRNEHESVKEHILTLVTEAEHQRLRPHELHEGLRRSLGASRVTIQRSLNDLIREGKLVFTYRDPCSYVETPELVGTTPAA
jgi:DNA-binding GntR family transcriptional regulator